MSFAIGSSLTVAFAAIVKFACARSILFAGFSLAIGLVLVAGRCAHDPAVADGCPRHDGELHTAARPANQMSYDTQQFYNAALAIIAGIGAGVLAFRLLPPLSPALRAGRLLR